MELAPDVALVGGLMGEPARAAMLVALLGGRARPAGELAFIGKVAPQTASFHLRKLVDASLLAVEKRGKHCYYRLVNERVAAALAPRRADACAEPERVTALRFARSCYRHLAGMLAVAMCRTMLDRELLAVESGTTYRLTDRGREWCDRLEVDLTWPKRAPIRACLDWTERRPHIGGPLGVALLARMTELRWVVRNPDTRAVRVTHTGARQLQKWLGIATSVNSPYRVCQEKATSQWPACLPDLTHR